MKLDDVLRARLAASGLVRPVRALPQDVVAWCAAVQAQDYAGAKWAIGQRSIQGSDAGVEAAFESGRILRTHVLRPTWHFVLPEDVRWLQRLTAPRVLQLSAPYYRQAELDEKLFAKSRKVLEKALLAKRYLTRDELAQKLSEANIKASGPRLSLIVMRAELDRVLVSGPRRGKHFTYALLDERAPKGRELDRDESLRELALRYFASHGPATAHDFGWWSGLTLSDAKLGIELAKGALHRADLDEKAYWFVEAKLPRVAKPHIRLLPNYDEYLVAYKDRDLLLQRATSAAFMRERLLSNHVVLKDGAVVGRFQRTIRNTTVALEVTLVEDFTRKEHAALEAAAQTLASFLGLKLEHLVTSAEQR
jgi:hypothetical protein